VIDIGRFDGIENNGALFSLYKITKRGEGLFLDD